MLTDGGTIQDDAIITNCLKDRHYRVVLNAGNKYKDLETMRTLHEKYPEIKDMDVKISHLENFSYLAL